MHDVVLESRFEIEERIGRGAWGDVFRARDRETGTVVALKTLHQHLTDPVAMERFAREARLLAGVSSEHVVRYVDSGVETSGRPWLAVEWLAGEDLSVRLRRAPLAPEVAIEIVRQAALGLAALHDVGIVHRDVKPGNVFLLAGPDKFPKVKILDLGIARADNEMTLTQGGLAIGTPYYMAPEQISGSGAVSPRSDVFSLGVLLFEAVAHKRPFSGDNLFSVLAKIVLQEQPRLRDAAAGVPRELDDLCAKAMARAPENRFASARDLVAALAALPRVDTISVEQTSDGHELPTVTTGLTLGVSGSHERRVVTAVFAKLASDELAATDGFTAIAGEHGGEAYPLLGRNLVAVFGATKTTGDEARRAARAALAMRDRLGGVRLSIATGRALAGAIGLQGDVIERGAVDLDRADQQQSRRRVQVDTATARLLGDSFHLEESGGAFMLRGVRRSAGVPTLLGKATPCVGRDREIATLVATYEECASEPVARAVLVLAPAGAGKSRVRAELLEKLARRDDPPLILVGRGDALTAGSPLGLIAPCLRRLCGVLDGEPLADQRKKLVERIGRNLKDDERDRVIDRIGEIAGIEDLVSRAPDRKNRPFEDAMLRGDRMRAAFVDWIAAECRAQPVVLVLEDLQWGDVPSIAFVDAALRALGEAPLFVLALARPEVKSTFPSLFAERNVQELPLGGLTRRACEDLCRAVLGASAKKQTIDLIVERADGNAFFLEELIRAAESGTADLPDTVIGAVQARLDALGSEAKHVLKAASVFGRVFWRGGVLAVLGKGGKTGDVASLLDELARREVIGKRPEASFPNEAEFTLRQTVREAAYGMLSDSDRAIGHLLAANWLEAAGEADPMHLAEHLDRANQPERASVYYRRGADQALRGNDFVAAIARADKAIACGDATGLPDLVKAEAHRWRGELALAAAAAAKAAGSLPRDGAAWFHAVRETIAANGRLGAIVVVVDWARTASAIEPPLDARGAQLASLVPAAVHFVYAGKHEPAAELVARVDAILASGADVEPVVMARVHQLRAIVAWHDGDAETSIRHQHEALRAFERGGDQRSACLTRANVGFLEAQLGQLDAAETVLRLALATATRLGLDTIAALSLHNLGAVLGNKGALAEGIAVESRAIAAFEKQGDPRLLGSSRAYLAELLASSGDAAGAEREARAILAGGPKGALEIGALAYLARALLLQHRAAEALASARTAMERLGEIGAIEEFDAAARLAFADALEANGNVEAAKAVITDAAARIRVKVERLRDPETRRMMMENVPANARIFEKERAIGF